MPTTNKRISTLAREAADEFSATLLHNRVYDQVKGGHTRDPALRRVIDLAEDCYNLATERDQLHGQGDGVGANVFDAAETLNDQIDRLVREEVATACLVIVRNAREWDDHWDDDEIDAAITEAETWLADHADARDRAEAVLASQDSDESA